MTTALRGLALILGAALLAQTGPAAADNYPTRTINLVIPYPAGGNTDAFGRAFAEFVERTYDKRMIVENRDGASGMIGTEYVMRQPADGYTLIYFSTATALSMTAAGKEMELGRHLDPLGGINQSQGFWTVNTNVIDADSLDGLAAYLKNNPGTTYGSIGVGSTPHMDMLAFSERHGLDMVHIPYRGMSGVATAMLGGEVGLALGMDVQIIKSTPHLKVLAIAGPQKSRDFPDVPLTAELGYPESSSVNFGGFALPPGAPEEVRALLKDWVSAATRDQTFIENVERVGTTMIYRSPEVLQADMNSNTARYREIMLKYDLNK